MGNTPLRYWSLYILFLPFLLSFVPRPAVAQAGEEPVVTQLAYHFMHALSIHDTETLSGLLAPQAMVYSVREGDSGPVYGVRTRENFLEGIGSDSREFLERIWEPVVEVSGGVAMVWAPYDFHLEGSFSHCGIDILTYLKLEGGWKVTSITYDVVREGCVPSPLGEPGPTRAEASVGSTFSRF